MDRVRIGITGQSHAEVFLKKKGYKLITSNWRSKLGEIDLIMRDKDTLIFVEVKALTRFSRHFQPEDHLTPSKERKLKQLALAYLNWRNIGGTSYRIDLVAVDLDRDLPVLDIRHYENIIEDT